MAYNGDVNAILSAHIRDYFAKRYDEQIYKELMKPALTCTAAVDWGSQGNITQQMYTVPQMFTFGAPWVAAQKPRQPSRIGYEGSGPQSFDTASQSDIASAVKILSDKTRAAAKRGAIMAEAVGAMQTAWRSNGRPHCFDID